MPTVVHKDFEFERSEDMVSDVFEISDNISNLEDGDRKIYCQLVLSQNKDIQVLIFEDKFVKSTIDALSFVMKYIMHSHNGLFKYYIDIDDEIVEAEAERMYKEFMQRMSMQGINEEIYLQYANTTKKEVVNKMKDEALKRVKNRYLLEAVIKEEKLSVSDKDANKELKDMAIKYNMTESDVEKAIGGLEMLKYDMTMRKAIDVIKGEVSEEKEEKKTTKKSSKKEDK